ncbi:DUF1236 domain-containing protein [Aquamicrobium soli]|jgi:Flp pilus assembly protein CpaB|uniref:DUF1236 domain-containing protein n=1 Tax=Aquamicrobium soli TaxID=1811518 RepID=A0ABV7K2R8_9HYPH
MKRLLPLLVICTTIGGASLAVADTVVIQPEQQTVIKEYVQKNPVASVSIAGLELSVGAKVPDKVVLHEVPDVKYRYTVIDNQTVLVDPDTHEIVEIVH